MRRDASFAAESSRETDAPLPRALALARAALSEPPSGLLTDVDGTLSPIVAEPGLARLVEGADGALAALARRLAVVAVITGRAPHDARRLVGRPEVLVAGNHGMEWLEPGAATVTPAPAAEPARRLVADALARLPVGEGIVVEDKGLSATVHYRGATDPDRARRRIEAALADVAPGLERRPGRMSVELRPRGLGDKGTAARAIVERFGLRGVVVMGDDITDLDMFAAVDELRRAGRLRAAIVAVGGADGEVPPSVAGAADVVIASPADAAALLSALGGT